jgi:hypothetical protein
MRLGTDQEPLLQKIACVEWHDAQVEAVVVHSEDPSALEFVHLPVYHEVSAEKFQLWSYRATLQIFGLHRLSLDGAGGDADYISNAVAFGDNGLVTSGTLSVGERVPVDRLEVVFGSGRKVELCCSHVRLVLQERLEYVEDWDGPLSTHRPGQ